MVNLADTIMRLVEALEGATLLHIQNELREFDPGSVRTTVGACVEAGLMRRRRDDEGEFVYTLTRAGQDQLGEDAP